MSPNSITASIQTLVQEFKDVVVEKNVLECQLSHSNVGKKFLDFQNEIDLLQ